MEHEEKAIEMIEKSMDEKHPPGQRNMPYYYDNKIMYLNEAIECLEKTIKKYKKDKKHWDPYSLNNNSNNNNNNNKNKNENKNEYNSGNNMNLSNGGRRKTHKKRN